MTAYRVKASGAASLAPIGPSLFSRLLGENVVDYLPLPQLAHRRVIRALR